MEETNLIENNVEDENTSIVSSSSTPAAYDVALKINTMLNVLTFTIIIIFLYKFLKNCFRKN